MRILEVSRYKNNFADHQLPFVTEQGEAIRALGHEVDYFLVKGNYIKAVGALKAKIRSFQPDIVHAHFGLSAITAELQSLVPVVTTFHNGETLNWHVNLMSSLMSLRAKHVIYVAQHIRDLSYFKARHYSIIPCGVPMDQMTIVPQSEARRQLGWSPDKKYILFGGAFSNTRKNYALLRDAVAQLGSFSTTPDSQLGSFSTPSDALLGPFHSPSNPQLVPQLTNNSSNNSQKEQANPQSDALACSPTQQSSPLACSLSPDSASKTQLGEQGNSPLTAHHSPLPPIEIIEMKGLSRAECVLRMCACDLFALPSHSEGSPQALKEAMACNCPCLATDIADVRYLFGNEPGHWILRNPRKTHERWDGDEHSLDEMVELLKEALAFEGRTNGRERILALELSNEQVAQRIIQIYESVLKEFK